MTEDSRVESFKALADIGFPDFPSASFALRDDQTGEAHPLTLELIHADLAALTLNGSVPADIQNHFLTAKHLALYSWFVYRFTMPAQLQAYASIEYALRERFKELDLPAPLHLRGQLEFAAARNFLTNEGFCDWPGHVSPADRTNRKWLENWIARMPETVSYFRNELAHGSFLLYPQHEFVLRFAADAINQLYPN